MAGAVLCANAVAEEVYFDTVSTREVHRDHGRYFGAFAGGSTNGSASFGGDLDGFGSSGGNDGWFLGLEFGYSFKTPAPLRPSVELEFLYLNSDLNARGPGSSSLRSDLRVFSLMANTAIALDLSERRQHVGDFWANLKPYVGAGFGGAIVRQNNFVLEDDMGIDFDFDDSDFSWGWQVFAGLEYAFTDSFSLYGEYKRVSLLDFANGDISDGEFDLFALGFKVQY